VLLIGSILAGLAGALIALPVTAALEVVIREGTLRRVGCFAYQVVTGVIREAAGTSPDGCGPRYRQGGLCRNLSVASPIAAPADARHDVRASDERRCESQARRKEV
jgi:hypothetical protein